MPSIAEPTISLAETARAGLLTYYPMVHRIWRVSIRSRDLDVRVAGFAYGPLAAYTSLFFAIQHLPLPCMYQYHPDIELLIRRIGWELNGEPESYNLHNQNIWNRMGAYLAANGY